MHLRTLVFRWLSLCMVLSMLISAAPAVLGQEGDTLPVHVPLTPDSLPAAAQVNRWQRTPPLIEARRSTTAFATGTHVFVLGGFSDVVLSSIERAPIEDGGSLGSWELLPPMTSRREGMGVLYHDGFVYLLGGSAQYGTAGSQVERAAVLPDGSLGDWSVQTALPAPRWGLSAVVHNRYIYVVGGYATQGIESPPVILRTKIKDDGSLGEWVESGQLPSWRNYTTAAVWGNSLYVLGGFDGNTKLNSILKAQVFADGGLGTFESAGSLSEEITQPGVVVFGSQMFVVGGGGIYGPRDRVEVTTVNSSGVLAPWKVLSPMTVEREGFGIAHVGSHVYVLSGLQSLMARPTNNGEWVDLSEIAPPALEYGFTINHGALFTNQVNVELSIAAPASIESMQISNDGGFGGAQWEPLADTKYWVITRFGNYVIPRVVYIRFKGFDGMVSSPYQDDIILDETAPTGSVEVGLQNASVAALTDVNVAASAPLTATVYLPTVWDSSCKPVTTPNVTLHLAAQDDVSGVSQMLIDNAPDFACATWQPFAAAKSWYVQTGRLITVYVKYKDNAGNVSNAFSDSITIP